MLEIDAQLAGRKILDMPHRRHDGIAAPRYFVIVFAFVGDSTMIKFFAMTTPSTSQELYHPYQISKIHATRMALGSNQSTHGCSQMQSTEAKASAARTARASCSASLAANVLLTGSWRIRPFNSNESNVADTCAALSPVLSMTASTDRAS